MATTSPAMPRSCIALLNAEVMPLCQYYAYVEILDEREMELFQDPDKGTALWQAYRAVSDVLARISR